MRRALASVGLALGALIFAAACGDKAKPSASAGGGATGSRMAANAASAAAAVVDGGSKVVVSDISENDFVENDRNRDPFRTYVRVEQVARIKNQKDILLSQYAVDELHLKAIVIGEPSRAMFVDPLGKGWVLTRGQFVGRPETVHTGGQNGADYTVIWRIDRIRPSDVVMVREDPANPSVPPATKVLPLHPGKQDEDQL